MPEQDTCNACQGDRYILIGCCSGTDCGCMGHPVGHKNCPECNADGNADYEGGYEYFDHLEMM